MSEKKPPLLKKETTIIGTKIIAIFGGIFFLMKLIAVFTQEMWVLPNLIVTLPALILAGLAVYLLKTNKSSWSFVIVSFIIIIAIRAYETSLVQWLHSILQ
ncbi:MAG: hypothetical protein ACQESK_08215 [Bacteroidota bacterium]